MKEDRRSNDEISKELGVEENDNPEELPFVASWIGMEVGFWLVVGILCLLGFAIF